MNKFNKLGLSLATIAILSIGFTGCGSDNEDSETTTNTPLEQITQDDVINPTNQDVNSINESSNTPTDVTVERGKVYDAIVKDSSEPFQLATQKDGENIYTFADTPTYPIVVTNGWIDVDGDGKKTTKDMSLDIEMSSYSNEITPVTTYISAPTQEERDEKLQTLLSSVDIDKLSGEELLKLPSEALIDAQIVMNAIYAEMIQNHNNNEDFNLEDLGETVSELTNLSLDPNISSSERAITLENYLIKESNIHTIFQNDMIQENETQEYIDAHKPKIAEPVADINELLNKTFYIVSIAGIDSYYSKVTMPSAFTVERFTNHDFGPNYNLNNDNKWELDEHEDNEIYEEVSVVNGKLKLVSKSVYKDENGNIEYIYDDTVTLSIIDKNTEYLTIQYESHYIETYDGKTDVYDDIGSMKYYFNPTAEILDPSLISLETTNYAKSRVKSKISKYLHKLFR